jgi:hypothetical protein
LHPTGNQSYHWEIVSLLQQKHKKPAQRQRLIPYAVYMEQLLVKQKLLIDSPSPHCCTDNGMSYSTMRCGISVQQQMNRSVSTAMLKNVYVKIKTKHIPQLKKYIIHQRSATIVVALLIVLCSVTDCKKIGRILSSQVSSAKKVVPTNQNMVDIISVGSLLKEQFQNAQETTFGQHHAVRNFFRVTEMTDTDRECFTELTYDQLDDVMTFCNPKNSPTWMATRFREMIFRPKKNAGWMCAQKRPIDGLNHVLKQYKDGSMDLPKYLFIIDDDTYINMDSLTDMLLKNFSYEVPQVVAGCNFVFLRKESMTFPYGGFGSFISRASIQRLLQPINCTDTYARGQLSDPFSRLTCWRINQNNMGEKQFFTDGMSVSDLMYTFSSEQPFSKAASWPKDAGYCFHSDHALAYFFNMYHIAVPDGALAEGFRFNDDLRKKYKYVALHKSKFPHQEGECMNQYNNCTSADTLCHYIQPTQMVDLFQHKAEIPMSSQ